MNFDDTVRLYDQYTRLELYQENIHDIWNVYHLDLCTDCCKCQNIFIDISVTMGQHKVITICMDSY